MEGRATGTAGQRKAAEYLAQRFLEAGLVAFNPGGGPGAFLLPYTLTRSLRNEAATAFQIGGLSFKAGEDVLTAATQPLAGEVIFIGYGIHAPHLGWNDPAGEGLKGRWLAMWEGGPDRPADPRSKEWEAVSRTEAKLEWARKLGAAGCLFVQVRPDREAGLGRFRVALNQANERGQLAIKGAPTRGPVTFWLSAHAGKELGIERKAGAAPGPPQALGAFTYAPSVLTVEIPASNVVGLIPGTDPKLKEEFIVLSAHHDHVGLEGGKMHPGADDNASGTAAILEVARLLRDAQPRRGILVLSVSGEEIGLWGSQAFAVAPPVALDHIQADINLDMIGRNAIDELNVTPAFLDGAVGTLTRDARLLGARQGIRLLAEADKYWYRSDHYSFAKQGIPAIFFFGGMHTDYHEASDTPDKINFAKVARVVALARDLALRVANAPEAPAILPRTEWSSWVWPSPIRPSIPIQPPSVPPSPSPVPNSH